MSLPILETKVLYRKLLSLVQPEIVFDIGSCDGFESIKAAKILPKSTVVAFEANPTNFRKIIENSDIEKYGVSVHNMAIQNKDDNVFFNVIDAGITKNRGSSSLFNKPNLDSEQIEVRGNRLDSFAKKHYPCGKTLSLWIDVEGAGYEVLEGIESMSDRIVFFQIEVEETQIWEGQRTRNDIIGIANSLGFYPIARGAGDIQYDMVFMNKVKGNEFDIRGVLRKTILVCRIRKFFILLREVKRKFIYKS